MITRIVKLTFYPENVDAFRKIFNESQHLIRGFTGCMHVELLNDKKNTHIFFTRSIWNTEHDLEHYRNSDMFKTTWAETKRLFSEKAEAWTLVNV